MKKFLIAVFAALILLSAISCADQGEEIIGNSDATSAPTVSTDSVTSGETTVPVPEFPEELTGNGCDFVIFDQGFWHYTPLDVIDVGIVEMNNEAINDAAYFRDRLTEDKLGVKIQRRTKPECYDSYNELQVLVNSGDCDIDLCLLRTAILTQAITNNILNDLDNSSLTYFNPDNPWWNSNSYEALSVNGTHYGVCGDFTITDDLSVWALYFNKTMLKDLSLDDPYELVRKGTWTYDKLFAMGQHASADLDGNGMTYEDRWGVTYIRDTVSGMINSVGVEIGKKDEDDIPYMTFYTDANVSKVQWIYEKLYDLNQCYNIHARGGNEVEIFTESRALFTFGAIYYAPQMRRTYTDFGILPYPKFDEAQTNYISSTSPLSLTVLCTPKNNKNNAELVGAFMEYYSYLGSEKIIPEFYDKLLTWKVARDEESREMFNYIFDDSNTIYDVGNIYNFGDFSFWLVDMTLYSDLNFASLWAKYETKTQESIHAMLEAIDS